MNIIFRELRSNLKSLIIWSLSIIFFVYVMMAEFSAYYNNPEMNEILDSMPEALMKAFSMAGANVTTVSGFMSLAAVYFVMMLGVYSALLGASIISKEERDKTVEFFLSLPVSRTKAIISKWFAGMILSLLLNVVIIATLYVTTLEYDKMADFNTFMLLLAVGMYLVQILFFSIGFALAASLKQHKLSGRLAIGIFFGTYILSILSGLNEKLENLKYLSPFKYFEAATLARTLEFELVYVIISLGIMVIGAGVALVTYSKRDLHI